MHTQASLRVKRTQRLSASREFQDTIRRGKKFSDQYFRVFVSPDEQPACSFGISVGRKIGAAARRNRYKRLIREVLRLQQHDFLAGKKVVIILANPLPVPAYRAVEKQLSRLFRNAGIYTSHEPTTEATEGH